MNIRQAALDLYVPPFRLDHGYIRDSNGQVVADDGSGTAVGTIATRIRGWGRIQYMDKPEQRAEALQDEVGHIVVEALNAYWVANTQTVRREVPAAQEGDTMTQQTELAPCPFCGAQAIGYAIEPHMHSAPLKALGVPDHHGSYVIEGNCECGSGLIGDDQGEVTARWNRRAAPEARAQVEPDFYTVFARYEEDGETGWIPLPGYSNETEHGVKNLVLEAARKEGYTGTAADRLIELGWEIRPVYLTAAPAAPVREPLSDELARDLIWRRNAAWIRSDRVNEDDALELIRAVEQHHGITAPSGERENK